LSRINLPSFAVKTLAPWQTIRGRLLLLAILTEVVMLGLLVTNSLRLLTNAMGEQARSHVEQIVPVLNSALIAPLAQRDYATVQAILEESTALSGIDYLVVQDSGGKRVAGKGWLEDQALPAQDLQFSLFDSSKPWPRYDAVVPIQQFGQKLGTLHLGLNLSQIVAAHHALLMQGVGIALLEIALSAGIIGLLGYLMTRHVADLTRASEEVAAGNLQPHPVPESEDEIGRLGMAFNAMSRAVSERIGQLTEMGEAQRSLRKTVEHERGRLTALIEAMTHGVLFVDRELNVVYANTPARRMWYLPEDCTWHGMPFRQLVQRHAHALNNAALLLAPPELSGSDHEQGAHSTEFAWRDGRIFLQLVRPVHGGDQQQIGWLYLYEDVTLTRRAARDLLVAKELAEENVRARAAFLAMMSHEIRTPMNGILGMTDLALNTELTEEQREYLTWSRASAESLLTILNDVLDFSKIEAGRLELECIEFNLSDLLNEIVGLFRAEAARKHLTLEKVIAPEVPVRVSGDPVRLRQILNNLFSNAFKFTSSGGIQLRVTLEAMDGPDGQGRLDETSQPLRFVVQDSGIGIPPDKLESVFDAFTQAEASTTRRFGGTGLGLSIVRQLVELMQGRIWAESTLGQGSAFCFTACFGRVAGVQQQEALVVTRNAPPVIPDPTPRQLSGDTGQAHALHLLLVEDTPVNQKLGMALLARHGHHVTLATNGAEALALCQQHRYDLILMDMQMPVMDGLEATRRLRQFEAEKRLSRTPILALTANAGAEDRTACLEAGMDDFISKPFRSDEMAALIVRHSSAAA
jgi:signal transduction histidine kinase/CheY-like chemotaxis protein